MVTEAEALSVLEEQGQMPPQENSMSSQAYSNMSGDQGNLIQWQLELDNILERIENLLRGNVLTDDGNGNMDFRPPEDKSLVILNEFGVQLIMNFISFYMNRNTILSNYREERIMEILLDLGHELADLVYINYQKMGLDTVEKRSRSIILTMNVLHMIESSYNRALHGEERDSLRKARIVNQTQTIAPPMAHAGNSQGFSMNPFKRYAGA